MSVKVMGQAWELDLPHNKLLVLLAMADHADHEGRHVHPSVELIAWKTGYEERQVRRILRSLEKDRILKIEKLGGGRNKTTEYRICLENGVKKSPFVRNGVKMSPNSDIGGHYDSVLATKADIFTGNLEETWTFLPPKGDIAMSPEPSLEPSRKEKDSLTTFESSSGTGSDASLPDHDAPAEEPQKKKAHASKKPRKAKVIIPIPTDHWLWGLLQEHSEDFDLNVLNDWHWWETFAKTFNGHFTRNFVSAAFADLVLWFAREPQRRPHTKKGWQERIHYSLNRYYTNTYSRRSSGQASSQNGGVGFVSKDDQRRDHIMQNYDSLVERTKAYEAKRCGEILPGAEESPALLPGHAE